MAHSDLVRSVLRSLDILDLVAQSERGMSLQEICKVLGLKQPTAYNLIRTLVSRNYIDKSPTPVRYRLGRAVMRLADDVTNHDLVRRASDALLRLYDDIIAVLPHQPEPTEEVSVAFAQSVGGEIRLLLRIRNDRPRLLSRPMSLMSPYRSTSSLIYQAYWTHEERAAYRRAHPFAEHGASLWTSEAALDAYLAQIRQDEHASPPIYPPDEFRLSAPVFGEGNTLMGAVGVGLWTPMNKLTSFRVTRLAIDAAKALSTPSPHTRMPPISRTRQYAMAQ